MTPFLKFALAIGLISAPFSAAANTLCYPATDTALYADAALTQELRPIFQYDGAQFVPETQQGDVLFGASFDNLMRPTLEENSYTRAADWICEDLAAPVEPATDDMGHVDQAEAAYYDLTPEACAQELSDTSLVVTATSYGFFESTCDIMEATDGADGTTDLQLMCYGSGEEWQAQMKVTPQEGGLILESDGMSYTYLACPAKF